ncbi:motility associated factor glycosyltransferase family protein [Cohnella herbarum]|uniref:Motility associated factor glycosyltransferase family protein n=1 Tax=Cohnella herbarum TaxID=2728023 RepID=A0A7Z2ZMM3_9BACL|nr:6-hydroxymethylpterin diphosphokinase MptE-like protein [Cohnella herbarum]QJD85223.1 motility associated factor glycosyltransferase family protein [Cohnella herbarum]
MKKYAADNLMFLREQYPEIYKLVRNQTYNKELVAIEPAKNGQSNLLIPSEDGVGFHMYSKYDPELETKRWVESIDDNILNSNDVLVAGFGLGYHLDTLLVQHPDKRLYIYEPDLNVFLAAIETVDLRPILGSRQIAMFAIGNDEGVITELLIGMYKTLKGQFGFTVLPYCRKLAPDLESRLSDLIPKLALSYGTDVRTISHYKAEWLENMILNMERNLRTPTFFPLKDICHGMAAIIVGSGPSLGMEADILRELKKHVFIIAAGSSVQGLLHHGIEPHLIVSMDGGAPNQRVFEKLDVGHIPFLYIPSIKYEAIRDDRSPYLMHGFFDMDVVSHYFIDLTTEDGILASTSSVTGTCIQVAAHLGFAEITFIGQDFSYPGDRMYSDGVNHLIEWEKYGVVNSILSVESVAGYQNRTNHSMLNLKRDVEAVIGAFPNISFYNASTVGAVIEHTELKKFEEMIEEHQHHIIADDWFREKVVQTLSVFPEVRRQAILDKIKLTYLELADLHKKLKMLEKHIQFKSRDIQGWLQKFVALWSPVIEHTLYTKIFSFLLTAERNHTERHWSDMFNEADNELKHIKLIECISPLIVGLHELVPLMDIYITNLLEKLNERG